MKRASCSCCNFLCVVHAATYLKYHRYRLSCLPFVWHFLSRSPTSIALLFLQSCLNAHCVLAYIACWPLERRILHELYFACAATFCVPPVFDREWFHHLANGSQLHAFSQGCAFLCFVVHAHSIGDRRTETSSYGRKKKKKKKKHRLHCICLQEATSFPCFAMIGNGRVHRLLGTRRKVKIFGGSAHCTERFFRSRGSLLFRLHEGQLTCAY